VTPGGRDDLDDLAAELDGTFLGELGERLAAMREALAALEAGSPGLDRRATLGDLTRHAHSVKGGALLVGRHEIARLAGALELRFSTDQAVAEARPAPPEAGEALVAIERLSALDRPGLGAPGRESPGAPPAAGPEQIEHLVARLERQTD
jgi:chemotaxis protein histidine kinase CheA